MTSNARFGEKISYYLKVIEPLVLILRMVDGDDKNDMGYLYETMDKAKKNLRERNPKAYRKWWAIIDKRWEMTLHHDLHAAEFNTKNNVHNDGEVMRDTMNVITRLARTMNKRLDAMAEVERYKMKLGIYGGYDMTYAAQRLTPAEWWIQAKEDSKTLQILCLALDIPSMEDMSMCHLFSLMRLGQTRLESGGSMDPTRLGSGLAGSDPATQPDSTIHASRGTNCLLGARRSALKGLSLPVASLPFPGFLRHSCQFLAFWDIPTQFLAFWDIPAHSWLSRTFLPVLGFLGHPCRFPTFWDIPGFLRHSCQFLAFWDIPSVFWLFRATLASGVNPSPTQESARRFREVTWVLLHRVVPTVFPP
ncbi:hypothetical protein Taro_020731 [Colocasia esculenta]|uniref:Uncharacterized protein n=1 Tax=Colocasia esculenta TaxID=4460 RepID=A0A843UX37_COLES|nr:hypothetical protein [Colocasia esculenta]